MKKTLVALTVAAFAASSASALTIYENEGTKVDFGGSVRIALSKDGNKVTTTEKVTDANSQVSEVKETIKNRAHSNLANDGSRFNISVKHNLNEDFYALGHYETRFNKDASNTAGWGNIVTNKAYVGFGGQGHQVTFGKQNVIGDNIGQAGFDNRLDVGSQNIYGREEKVAATPKVVVENGSPVVDPGEATVKNEAKDWGILTASSDSAINYTYTGVKGLTLGANYNFANSRKDNEVSNGKVKSGFGFGAVYTFDVAENQALTFSAGYTHDDFATGNRSEKDKDGVYFGAKYQVDALTVAVDGGRGVEKVKSASGTTKAKLNYVRAGARYDVASNVGVYANYSYGTLKEVAPQEETYKNTAHQYMLGSDYAFSKQVTTYVEGRIIKQKDTDKRKVTDKAIGVGLRVFW